MAIGAWMTWGLTINFDIFLSEIGLNNWHLTDTVLGFKQGFLLQRPEIQYIWSEESGRKFDDEAPVYWKLRTINYKPYN